MACLIAILPGVGLWACGEQEAPAAGAGGSPTSLGGRPDAAGAANSAGGTTGADPSSGGMGGLVQFGGGANFVAGGGSTSSSGGVLGNMGGSSGSSTGGGAGTGPVTPGEKPSGICRLSDPVPGWASVDGGTTGGGTDMGSAVTVSSMSELQSAAGGSDQRIILVKPGEYRGRLSPGANKTIIGTAPGAIIKGQLAISGSDSHNIIVRNIAVQDNPCDTFAACRSGTDAVVISGGAHHVWLDHVDVSDGQDGNLDATGGSDYMTISWSKFHYTYDKGHRFSNLIAGSDDETASRGKLNMTYMNCWWGDRVQERQPRGRFGKIHVLNNYYNTGEIEAKSYLIGPGFEMSMVIENNFFDVHPTLTAIRDHGTPAGYVARGNEGTAAGEINTPPKGQVFTIPYVYTPMPASQVKDAVTAKVGGAGNTCTFE